MYGLLYEFYIRTIFDFISEFIYGPKDIIYMFIYNPCITSHVAQKQKKINKTINKTFVGWNQRLLI